MIKDRCDVFKKICKDSNDEINMEKVDSIYEENYNNFCELSDEVIGDVNVIDINSSIDNEKREITFEIIGKESTRINKLTFN